MEPAINNELTGEWLEEQFSHFSAEPKATFNPHEIAYKEESDSIRLPGKPVVSVKVLTYKQEHLLERALNSIVSQEVDFPVEILLCDDCSPDGTGLVARHFLDTYPDKIRYIRTTSNVGPNKNSRLAEVLARGKYLAICEGDDYWHDPSKLREQVGILENNPLVSVVHGRVRNQRGLGPQRVIESRPKSHGATAGLAVDITRAMLGYRFGVHNCSSIIRRDMLQRALDADAELFNSTQFIHGDVPRYLNMSVLGGFYLMDKEVSTYQVNDESLSQSKCLRKRVKILMSSHLVRWHFALRVLEDRGAADETLKRLMLHIYREGRGRQERAMAKWGRDRLRELGADIPWLRRLFPRNPLRAFISFPKFFGRMAGNPRAS